MLLQGRPDADVPDAAAPAAIAPAPNANPEACIEIGFIRSRWSIDLDSHTDPLVLYHQKMSEVLVRTGHCDTVAPLAAEAVIQPAGISEPSAAAALQRWVNIVNQFWPTRRSGQTLSLHASNSGVQVNTHSRLNR